MRSKQAAVQIAGLASLISLGCHGAGPAHMEHIEAAVDTSGRLHVLAYISRTTSVDGLRVPIEYRLVDETADGWDRLAVPGGWRSPDGSETTYDLHMGPDGELVAVIYSTNSFAVWEKAPEGTWEVVPIAPELLEALPDPTGPAAASWIGADGELRILHGELLLETEGGALARALPTGRTCDVQPVVECHFVATGDRAGEAVAWDGRTITVRQLLCGPDSCTWEPLRDHGLGDPGRLVDDWGSRIVLRTARGSRALVHHISRPQVRVASDGQEIILGSSIVSYGATARRSEGIAVVAATDSNELTLYLLVQGAAGFDVRTISLPTVPLDGSRRLFVAMEGEGASERAHVVLSTGPRSIAHLAVDVSTEDVVRRSFGIGG